MFYFFQNYISTEWHLFKDGPKISPPLTIAKFNYAPSEMNARIGNPQRSPKTTRSLQSQIVLPVLHGSSTSRKANSIDYLTDHRKITLVQKQTQFETFRLGSRSVK